MCLYECGCTRVQEQANKTTVSAEQVSVVLQQVSDATRAATDAARAAAQMVQMKSSARSAFGAAELTKIVPRPETFNPKNREEEHSSWMTWMWQFK